MTSVSSTPQEESGSCCHSYGDQCQSQVLGAQVGMRMGDQIRSLVGAGNSGSGQRECGAEYL